MSESGDGDGDGDYYGRALSVLWDSVGEREKERREGGEERGEGENRDD